MIKLAAPKTKRHLFTVGLLAVIAINFCFTNHAPEQDWLTWANKCLAQSYDPSTDTRLKKWDIVITDDSFIRLRKTYTKGKEEFYSFNLHRLNDMDYTGTTFVGMLQLKTQADDIIVQTRNDREGDVDTMTTVLNIPVKNMEPERLDSLREALNYFKEKGL